MIQRIQTIFTVIAAFSSLALYCTANDVEIFGSKSIVVAKCLTSFLLGVVSIFSYKKRQRQIMLNSFNIFINALLIGLLFYWLLRISGGISFPEKGIEPIFPAISILCYFLANIYIRKDERLVKSVDRIR